MARARGLGYSVAEVPISFIDHISGDSKVGGDEIVEYAKGCSTSGSGYSKQIINLPQPSPFFRNVGGRLLNGLPERLRRKEIYLRNIMRITPDLPHLSESDRHTHL
ncbi:hypothetical protein B9Z19DRAFT_967016 [Tuber borchii]|uniref:Uncharacterized protein n=1 Tax=Tuber borchii TaxID=42251 RepID=A0A2T7A4I4_TUBBO|nr:hypothetical protein B9Z19DRAFT_967016 [Tuber borchii]